MLKIKVIKGNLNGALKKLKKKFKVTGVLKELRHRKYFEKKSTKKRNQKDKAIHRNNYLNNNDE